MEGIHTYVLKILIYFAFCLLNNIAIAICSAKAKKLAKKFVVVDWDVHHGNGVQDIFEEDPRVLYVSLHRFGRGFYPGTGNVNEVGRGKGAGFNVNVAWRQGMMGNADYVCAFDSVIMPIAREFAPELVIISAGFDAAPAAKSGGTPTGGGMPFAVPAAPSGAAGGNDYDVGSNDSAEETLESHLLWQLNLTPMATSDRIIAMAIIDEITDDGLLGTTLEEICETLARNHEGNDSPPELEEVEEILRRIQKFDPTGVGARDLRECLLLQLEQLDGNTPWLKEARDLITTHLHILGNKDFATLVRQTHLSESELSQVVALIRTLQPRPGSSVFEEAADYEVPDVLVRKDQGRWLVELNPETLPKVRINDAYASLIKTVPAGPDKDYLRDNLQEAKWFLKSLQTRHDTLLKVATKIVEVQQGFLEHGPMAMKPLILADIAEQVDLHESTISRVTNRKYLATPQGLFELKYFFSSHVGTSTGEEVSSTVIRALIKQVTANENPRKPLSDSKIAAILSEKNINVARRTVAKYRESLSIPPSNERKQLV